VRARVKREEIAVRVRGIHKQRLFPRIGTDKVR